jgi:hypothetical protein
VSINNAGGFKKLRDYVRPVNPTNTHIAIAIHKFHLIIRGSCICLASIFCKNKEKNSLSTASITNCYLSHFIFCSSFQHNVNTSRSILLGIFNEFLEKEAAILLNFENSFITMKATLISSMDTTKPSITLDAMLELFIFFGYSV